MDKSGQLKRLADAKRALRLRIGVRRAVCTAAGTHVARPLAVPDMMYARWRALAPGVRMALLTGGLWATGRIARRSRIIRLATRILPFLRS